MQLTFLTAQLIIVDAIIANRNGSGWLEIKAAVRAHGYSPENWLTEVRGPLQSLINEKKVYRTAAPKERYLLSEEWIEGKGITC